MTISINGVVVPQQTGVSSVAGAVQTALSVAQYRIAPAVGAVGAVHAAITLPTSGTLDVPTGITNPDFPRVLAAKGGFALEVGNVVITGQDASGAIVTDTIALNGVTQVAGVKAFASVSNINVPQRTNAGDTVTIDTLNIFGVPSIVYLASYMLLHNFNGTNDAGTFVAAVTLSGNLYTIAGTPNGAKILDLVYLI